MAGEVNNTQGNNWTLNLDSLANSMTQPKNVLDLNKKESVTPANTVPVANSSTPSKVLPTNTQPVTANTAQQTSPKPAASVATPQPNSQPQQNTGGVNLADLNVNKSTPVPAAQTNSNPLAAKLQEEDTPKWQLELWNLNIKSEAPKEVKKVVLGDSNEAQNKWEEEHWFKIDKLSNNKNITKINKQRKVILGDSGVWLNLSWGKKLHFSYKKILKACSISIFTGILSAVLFLGYDNYLKISAEPWIDPQYTEYLSTYKNIERKVDNLLWLSKYNNYDTLKLTMDNGETNFKKIIKTQWINYVNKKDIIQKDVKELSQSILQSHSKINNLNQSISEYGFFSRDMFDIFESKEPNKEDTVRSVQRSLLSLEAIKFASAIKVFSYLDTFTASMADVLHMSKEEVKANMQKLVVRWERDIYLYLSTCYLNPMEIDYDCSGIGDFDKYYDEVVPNEDLDTEFFKKIIYYIDLKLEQTELPSFSIMFQKFDPSKDEITFTVTVNTFQQDELALLEQWILNPHIFVVTELVNFLKQSTFIVWESIDVKQLKIRPKVVRVGSTQFNVNTSFMSFALPIQKSTAREIFDFVEKDVEQQTELNKVLEKIKEEQKKEKEEKNDANIVVTEVEDREELFENKHASAKEAEEEKPKVVETEKIEQAPKIIEEKEIIDPEEERRLQELKEKEKNFNKQIIGDIKRD